MAQHRNLTVIDGIHILHAFEYADSTARLGDTELTPADVGKAALQQDDMTFWILVDDSPVTWVQFAGESFSPTAHKSVRQLIHFIDNGPADGFASGAYRTVTGSVFPTAVTWYDSSGAGKKKIVEKLTTWTGVLPTTVVWKMYDSSETLLVTVTDSITYSGVFETSRTRTIA